MTKQIDHNMPSMTPDKDQVEAFKSNRTKPVTPSTSVNKPSVSAPSVAKPVVKAKSSSALSKMSTVLIYLVLATVLFLIFLIR